MSFSSKIRGNGRWLQRPLPEVANCDCFKSRNCVSSVLGELHRCISIMLMVIQFISVLHNVDFFYTMYKNIVTIYRNISMDSPIFKKTYFLAIVADIYYTLCIISGIFQGTAIMEPPFPYYSHKTPLNYASGMEWE